MKPTRVLLVEDEVDVLRATTMALDDDGFQVIPASSGAPALVLFETETPDVAVLDLKLPDMDGVAVCRQIHHANASLPVIFLSAFDDPEIKRRACSEKSVEGYMCKPYDVGLLSAQIENAVSRRREVETLKELATHDPLTGLPNHRLLVELLNQAYHHALRNGSSIACLMIDVDRFRSINDEYGHPVGDLVLQEIARRLRAGVRRQDFLGRYGGEEFTAILPETDERAAGEVADRLRRDVSKDPFIIPDVGPRPVTISIGAAVLRAERTTPERLIEAADKALLNAKRTGRNRTCFNTDESPLSAAQS
jgi:diguanylate cyclase (GGDEF)-like protein